MIRVYVSNILPLVLNVVTPSFLFLGNSWQTLAYFYKLKNKHNGDKLLENAFFVLGYSSVYKERVW